MRWMLAAVMAPAICQCTSVEPDLHAPGRDGPAGASSSSASCTRTLSFAPMTAYRVLSGSSGVVIADLNGDGRPDLVVPGWTHTLQGGYDSTLVLLNKGDGTFASPVQYARHQDLVAVGDLNGDGKPDLVVTAPPPDALTVYLNDGDGRFTARPAMALPAAPTSPLEAGVGDVDGDRVPDLYWSTGGTLNALHGKGDGTFASAPVTVTFPHADRLAARDLDGDGVVDVVATGTGPSLDVFLNHGDGTFPSRGAAYTPTGGMTGWFFVDWNGDGRPDIFVPGSLAVLLDSGHGTFETQLAIAPPSSRKPDYMTVADMNGDGHADLVEGFEGGSKDTIEVWLNDGHDAFKTVVTASVTRYGEGIQAADLDGDGRLDLVAQSQPTAEQSVVSVLLDDMCPP